MVLTPCVSLLFSPGQVDRMFGWKAVTDADIETSLGQQRGDAVAEFERRAGDVRSKQTLGGWEAGRLGGWEGGD